MYFGFVILGIFHLALAAFHELFSPNNLYTVHLVSLFFLFYYFRKDKYVLPLIIFSSTYTLYLFPYFYFDLPYHYLVKTQTPDLTIRALAYQYTFYYLFFALRASNRSVEYHFPQLKLSKYAFFALVSFLLIMLVVNILKAPPNIGASYDGKNNSTVWIEYSFIFLVLLCSTTLSKKYRFVVTFVLLSYLIYPFLYSRRLQMIMVFLLIYYRYYGPKIRVITVYISAIAVFIILRIFESLRMGVAPTLLSLLITTNADGVTGSNQGGVMVSNTIYLYLVDIGVFDWTFRLKSLLGNLITGFVPGNFNFSETYINLRALEHMPLPGNGGYTAVYLYLWLGAGGVICVSLFLGYLTFSKRPVWVLRSLPLAILMTFPRLHSYNFLATIKVITGLLVLYMILNTVRRKVGGDVNKN